MNPPDCYLMAMDGGREREGEEEGGANELKKQKWGRERKDAGEEDNKRKGKLEGETK